MSADATGLFVVLFLIGVTLVAFRTTFFGIKLVVGMIWFVAFMYIQTTPPTGITEGSAVHVGLMVVCIGMGLMIVLAGLGRGISKAQDKTGNFSLTSESFHFKLPDWLKSQTPSGAEKIAREKRVQEVSDYRERMHRALNPNPKRRER